MPAAARTCVSFAHLAQVGERRVEVAPGLDTAQVPVVAIRADDVLPLAQRLVGQDLDRYAYGPDRPALGAERLAHLVGVRRTERLTERRQELHLVQTVVA